ncbi:MAG TPA: alpha/beta hydrolase [Bacillales bacterium]
MVNYKRTFKLDEQWCFLHLPEKPNGFAVMVIGDTNHYVNEKSSLWEEQEDRRQLLDTLLFEGYTVIYSNLYGKHWGNPDSCRLAEDLVHLIMKEETLNSGIHLLAEGMGALTALGLMENSALEIRSAAFINPCMDLNVYIKDVKETKWFYKRLLQQISEAYRVPIHSVRKLVSRAQSLEDYQSKVPVQIWHSTARTFYPFRVHSRPYERNRKKLGSPITLLLHVPERKFYFSKDICSFYKQYEKKL